MNLSNEDFALLPTDVQDALTLAGKPAKKAEDLSFEAAMASYQAGMDRDKSHAAMLAHAKAAAAHKAEATDGHAAADKASKDGDMETASSARDAAYKSESRARHETDQVVACAQALGHGPYPRFTAENTELTAGGDIVTFAEGLEDAVYLRAWSEEKRNQLKKGEIKGDFAGPDDSFPIAGHEDVTAASKSLGRAKGDTSAIKAKIIAIAKKFGWESGLPKAWQEPAENSVVFKSGPMDDLLDIITDDKGEGLTKWIPVLYPGKFNDLQFTAAMIKEMAATFNPKAESCPAKIGHEGPDTQEELSQIREVKIAPCTLTNGKTVETCLWVRMDRTPEALSAQTRYRKTSIEAWPPQHQSNPTPGKWNLKGLAFLGAAAPAVPNLPPTQLSLQPEGGMKMPVIELTEAEVKAQKDRELVLTSNLTTANNETLRLRAELAESDAKLATERKAKKAEQIKNELLQFSDKLLPAQMALLEPVFLALDSDDPTVTLSGSATPVSPRSCLLAFFQGYKNHGLTDPLNVPALTGKKTEPDGDELSDADYAAEQTNEYIKKNPGKTILAIKHGQQCVKDRAAARLKKK